MKEKELPKFEEIVPAESLDAPSPKARLNQFGQWCFAFVKFILGVSLLPFVYGSTVALLSELRTIDVVLQKSLWAGAIAFLIVYLFIWEPAKVYTRGYKIIEFIFRFMKPLVKVAPFLLPVYTLLLFAASLIVLQFSGSGREYFLFLFGLSTALHLVFSAKTLRARKGDFLKGNYIFGFSVVYILNILLLCFALSVLFEKFSFVNSCNTTFQVAKGVFKDVYKQLFILKS